MLNIGEFTFGESTDGVSTLAVRVLIKTIAASSQMEDWLIVKILSQAVSTDRQF
ncbi:hypothetical protein PN499_14535 [Kamptonema animale CS-326]|uniref:hypothetical protein n=1 Tax=Kamptonema animale TaxID=92934 RepID=UPI00232C37A8|nr:hypothetical protein [Kamptonema animale]MDB9512405.1 hypothetical protein [Kamptonema animale CS-326]